MTFQAIPIEQLRESKMNVRRRYDKAKMEEKQYEGTKGKDRLIEKAQDYGVDPKAIETAFHKKMKEKESKKKGKVIPLQSSAKKKPKKPHN